MVPERLMMFNFIWTLSLIRQSASFIALRNWRQLNYIQYIFAECRVEGKLAQYFLIHWISTDYEPGIPTWQRVNLVTIVMLGGDIWEWWRSKGVKLNNDSQGIPLHDKLPRTMN